MSPKLETTIDLPDTILAEVKFSTRESFPLPWRERKALITKDDESVGLLASLFWCGDRQIDGRWLIADVNESFRGREGRSISVSKREMYLLNENQSWLNTVKERLGHFWPPLLQLSSETALEGHEPLKTRLKLLHEHDHLAKALQTETVLEIDHLEAVQAIIGKHSEPLAGQIFQVLFAYLLALVGYRRITLNPVGVPDITASECAVTRPKEEFIEIGKLSLADIQLLIQYCESAGDKELAAFLKEHLPNHPVT